MNLIESLKKIISFIEDAKIPYMVFGGLANGIYGYERQTFDIDIKLNISLEKSDLILFISKISSFAKIMPQNPIDFISKTMVLPVEVDGVRVDLVFCGLDFEQEAIKHANNGMIGNVAIKVATVEDMIIQKAISVRDKDWLDIENLIKINNTKIDWKYLRKNIELFAEILDRPEIISKIMRLKNE